MLSVTQKLKVGSKSQKNTNHEISVNFATLTNVKNFLFPYESFLSCMQVNMVVGNDSPKGQFDWVNSADTMLKLIAQK